MIKLRQRNLTFALVMLVAIFAGCKAETPTTPSITTPGGTPSGGVTPPTNATLTLTASSTSPVVNSNVTLTATVTQNNKPVTDGTAVQFTTNFGTFTDTGTLSTIKITANGVATAMITASSAGNALVTAAVGTASKQVTISFGAAPSTTPPTSTVPTISTVNPASGKPAGGDTVIISGTNFTSPVRVLFQSGTTIKEGFVCGTCVTPTSITVITPAFDVTPGGSVAADIIVITQAGTAGEQRVTKSGAFTFASASLTPTLTAVVPVSGPSTGGTRITITGSGFSSNVLVTMGTGGSAGSPLSGQVQLQVLDSTFSIIHAITPEQRLIDPTLGTDGVTLRVLNVDSNKDAVLANAFRYLPKMAITTVGPTEGPFTGGTRVKIDGIGFLQPVGVVIGGIAAQVISVSGSEIVADTGAVVVSGCSDVPGAISVTNTDNGDSAIAGAQFTFRVPKPIIVSVDNPANLGGTTNIHVHNVAPGDFPRITIGGIVVPITAVSGPDANNTTTYTVQIPSNLPLNTQSCPAGGTSPVTTQFDVVFTSAITGCTDTAVKGITVNPPTTPILFVNPPAFQPFSATFVPGSAGPPIVPPSETPSPNQTISLVNNGTATLTISAITQTSVSGPGGCGDFSIVVPPAPIPLNQCESLPVSVKYNGPAVPASGVQDVCQLTFTTNGGNKTFLLVGSSQ